MKQKKQNLLSEIQELNAILSSIPKTNVIERVGFESRLNSLLKELNTTTFSIEPEKTRVTFRGAPVFGCHGIAADFGSKASGYFSEAFTAIVASIRDGLRYMGPIPNKHQTQLAITGIATGSFGFEFELPALEANLFSESGGAEEAVETLINLLEKSAQGSDDEVTEAVHAAHPRAVKKVVEFLTFMEKKGAWCGLEFKQSFFRYSDLEQLKFARERLSESSIHQSTESFEGAFQGSLPKTRTFQFQPTDEHFPIMGRSKISS